MLIVPFAVKPFHPLPFQPLALRSCCYGQFFDSGTHWDMDGKNGIKKPTSDWAILK